MKTWLIPSTPTPREEKQGLSSSLCKPYPKPRIASAKRRVKPLARLLRCATAPAGDSAPRLRLGWLRNGALLDQLIRAFLVVVGVSVACAWTWPGAFPVADPRRPVGRRVARGHLCAPRPARTWPSPCGASAHDPFRRRSWSHKARCPRTSVTKPSGCCTPAAISNVEVSVVLFDHL